MTVGVPKPSARPLQFCPNKCGKRFRSLRRLSSHVKSCGVVKKNKYNARKTVGAGGAFPSQLEARTYTHLMLMKASGHYAKVGRYYTVELVPGLKWKVDFWAEFPSGALELHEAKGISTGEYRAKLAVYRCLGPFPLHIWKADRLGIPNIVETVIPKKPKLLEVKEFVPGGEE